MEYTNTEICRMYRQAKDPKKQITIMAELNACHVSVIKEILADGGEITRTRLDWTPELDAQLNVMLAEGKSHAQIAVKFGVTRNCITNRITQRKEAGKPKRSHAKKPTAPLRSTEDMLSWMARAYKMLQDYGVEPDGWKETQNGAEVHGVQNGIEVSVTVRLGRPERADRVHG